MPPACASGNPLDTIFRPLRDLDIANFYESNQWIDFFIYLGLFISISRLTIGRRFEGREGRVLSGIIGLVLALSLTLMELKMGFSIRSFGAIAAGILIFVMGLVIFYLVKSVGSGNTAAGSFALIITYFLIRATVPDFFRWLDENSWAAWIHLALFIAVVVSFWKILSSLWSKGSIQSLGRLLERSHVGGVNQRESIDREKIDKSLIKSRLRRITRKGMKQGKEIIEDLKEIAKIIDEYGETDRGRGLIAEKIRDIAPRENLILNQIASLKRLTERIEEFDLRTFQELRARWDKVPEKEKNVLKEEILLEKDKILSEGKLKEMESEVMRFDKDFRYSLNMAMASLRSNQPAQASDWVSKAIKAEQEAVNILKEMKSLEDRLLRLTKLEFRTLKKEAKEERAA